MKIKKFLLQTDNIDRDSFVWNMTGSMIMAFQSVIMLMILTRILGLYEAGLFTIAYANANLFLTIGKYGMRNFQVSDVTGQFSFHEYRLSRAITTITMVFVALAYVIYVGDKNQYTLEKSLIIMWMCIFKAVDAFEDVYHGLYQRRGRLDVAGKLLTLRLGLTLLVFGAGLFVLKDLLAALMISTVVTVIFLVLFIKWSYMDFAEAKKEQTSFINVRHLLQICFPLFLGSFLAFYIGNAPKYSIDSVLNDELQACYGFIAMPVFVIGLLNNFIFNPMIYKMSMMWNERKIKAFIRQLLIQALIVAGITLACITGAYFLGVPVLSFLYNTDLAEYRSELLILLLGGGFLALSGLLTTVITIIRCQKRLMAGYVIVAALAYALSTRVVERYSIMGAAVLYLALMAALCGIFVILLIDGLVRKGKTDEKEN